MGSDEGEGGGTGRGAGWTGHAELFTRLPFSMRKTIKGLRGCSKFFCWTDKTMVQWVLAPDQVFQFFTQWQPHKLCSLSLQMSALLSGVLNIAINILTSKGDYFRKLLRDRLAHKSSSTVFLSTKRELEIFYVLDPSAHWPHASRNKFDLWLKHWYSGTSI